jgi:hypothetical protein
MCRHVLEEDSSYMIAPCCSQLVAIDDGSCVHVAVELRARVAHENNLLKSATQIPGLA